MKKNRSSFPYQTQRLNDRHQLGVIASRIFAQTSRDSQRTGAGASARPSTRRPRRTIRLNAVHSPLFFSRFYRARADFLSGGLREPRRGTASAPFRFSTSVTNGRSRRLSINSRPRRQCRPWKFTFVSRARRPVGKREVSRENGSVVQRQYNGKTKKNFVQQKKNKNQTKKRERAMMKRTISPRQHNRKVPYMAATAAPLQSTPYWACGGVALTFSPPYARARRRASFPFSFPFVVFTRRADERVTLLRCAKRGHRRQERRPTRQFHWSHIATRAQVTGSDRAMTHLRRGASFREKNLALTTRSGRMCSG